MAGPARYMQGVFAFPRLTPVVRVLLMVFLGAYILELILQQWVGVPVYQTLALTPAVPGIHTLWQVVTYPLVWPPAHVVRVLISLVFFWLIVAPFEERFGAKRTWQLAAATGLAAGVAALAVGLILPQPYVLSGFGPILLGAIGAFAWTIRDRQLMFFGVIPMKGIHLILLVLGITLLMFLASKNVVNLVADLAGLGAGIGFVEWMKRPRGRRGPRKRSKPRKKAPFTVVRGGDGEGSGPRWLN